MITVMSLSLVSHVLRYAALAMAAVMAVLAFLRKTKDEAGRPSPSGKWYLGILFIATLVAFGTQFVDDVRQERSTAEQIRANSDLLEQVIRGQYPLQGIRASYQVSMPTMLPGVEKYQRRLADSMPQIIFGLPSTRYRQAHDIRSAIMAPSDVRVMFCSKSPLMPSPSREMDAARLVGSLNIRLLLYRNPVDPSRWPLYVFTGAVAVEPDVEMWFAGGDRCIEYRATQQRLILRDIGAATDSNQWQNSGLLLSVLDLRGAQMVVDIHPRRSDQLQGQPLLEDFELFIGSLQALWLPKARFTLRQLPNGDVAYEFIFPRTLDEILSLQRRYGNRASG